MKLCAEPKWIASIGAAVASHLTVTLQESICIPTVENVKLAVQCAIRQEIEILAERVRATESKLQAVYPCCAIDSVQVLQMLYL